MNTGLAPVPVAVQAVQEDGQVTQPPAPATADQVPPGVAWMVALLEYQLGMHEASSDPTSISPWGHWAETAVRAGDVDGKNQLLGAAADGLPRAGHGGKQTEEGVDDSATL